MYLVVQEIYHFTSTLYGFQMTSQSKPISHHSTRSPKNHSRVKLRVSTSGVNNLKQLEPQRTQPRKGVHLGCHIDIIPK